MARKTTTSVNASNGAGVPAKVFFGRDTSVSTNRVNQSEKIIHMPTEIVSEELIIERMATGDSQAMRLLIERFGSLIWGIARRYVRPEHFIEDVSQEILTEIWKKAGKYDRNKASAKTFVALITRRRCIDWLRRKSKEPVIESLEQDLDEHLENHTSVEIQNELLKKAITMLSENEQEIFQLHFQQGMTHSEISDTTGIPLGTIKTKLRRGLLKLRQTLKEAH